jgi:hypothetical protein
VRAVHPVRTALSSIPAAQRRAAGVLVVALAGDQLLDPDHNHVPLCPLHALTGIWCPFCGGLRSAFELTRLHARAALQDNIFVVGAAPIVLAWWIDATLRARRGQRRRTVPRAAVAVIVALALVFTVVRNLPFGAALRPGG